MRVEREMNVAWGWNEVENSKELFNHRARNIRDGIQCQQVSALPIGPKVFVSCRPFDTAIFSFQSVPYR